VSGQVDRVGQVDIGSLSHQVKVRIYLRRIHSHSNRHLCKTTTTILAPATNRSSSRPLSVRVDDHQPLEPVLPQLDARHRQQPPRRDVAGVRRAHRHVRRLAAAGARLAPPAAAAAAAASPTAACAKPREPKPAVRVALPPAAAAALRGRRELKRFRRPVAGQLPAAAGAARRRAVAVEGGRERGVVPGGLGLGLSRCRRGGACVCGVGESDRGDK
jgi:hypothetical protein